MKWELRGQMRFWPDRQKLINHANKKMEKRGILEIVLYCVVIVLHCIVL
jgi:hypothetical protein